MEFRDGLRGGIREAGKFVKTGGSSFLVKWGLYIVFKVLRISFLSLFFYFCFSIGDWD